MGQRVIPVAVTAEYIGGDGVTLGAAGSHNSVLIEYDFRSAGPQWDDISGRYVLWTNPQGNSTNRINLGISEKVAGYEGVYQAAPPADAMCVPGWAEMVVVGFTLDGNKEVTKIKTEPSRFRVLPGSSRAADNEGVAPTVADQLQAEIEAVDAELDNKKVNKPVEPYDPNGNEGQFLSSLGNGKTKWVDTPLPTQEQVEIALEDHPEWTTTVRDGAISTRKLADGAVSYDKVNADLGAIISDEPYLFAPHLDPNTMGGNCYVFIWNNHAVLIDLGCYGTFETIKAQLYEKGVDTIDGLFITHWHQDHDGAPFLPADVAAVTDIANYYDRWKESFDLTQAKMFVPRNIDRSVFDANHTGEEFHASFPDSIYQVSILSNDTVWHWHGITFTVRNQSAEDYQHYINVLPVIDGSTQKDLNPTSALIYADFPHGQTFLSTADVTQPGQAWCVKQGYVRHADVCSMHHHGITYKSFIGFMEKVSPQFLHIANNNGNRQYGMRDPSIRVAALTAQVFENTANPNGVLFSLLANGVTASGTPSVGFNSEYLDAASMHEIYIDERVADTAYQDGTRANPYNKVKTAEMHIVPDTVIVLLSDVTQQLRILNTGPVWIRNDFELAMDAEDRPSGDLFDDRASASAPKLPSVIVKNARVEISNVAMGYSNFVDSTVYVHDASIEPATISTEWVRSDIKLYNISLQAVVLASKIDRCDVDIFGLSGTYPDKSFFGQINLSRVMITSNTATSAGGTQSPSIGALNMIMGMPTVSDLDDAPSFSWVYFGTGQNGPESYCVAYTVQVGGYRQQIAFPQSINSVGKIYVRRKNNTTWSAWKTITGS